MDLNQKLNSSCPWWKWAQVVHSPPAVRVILQHSLRIVLYYQLPHPLVPDSFAGDFRFRCGRRVGLRRRRSTPRVPYLPYRRRRVLDETRIRRKTRTEASIAGAATLLSSLERRGGGGEKSPIMFRSNVLFSSRICFVFKSVPLPRNTWSYAKTRRTHGTYNSVSRSSPDIFKTVIARFRVIFFVPFVARRITVHLICNR